MLPERMVDCGDLYRSKRQALLALARSLSPDQLQVHVPATPEWTVRDVVSHLVGIAADLNASEFGSGDPDAWTAAQVATRRARSLDGLAEEWEQEGPTFEDGLRLFGYELGSHFLGDLLQHTADIRHALGLGRFDDDIALAVALDHYLVTFGQALEASALGSVVVRLPDEEFTVGSGSVVAKLTGGRFEVFRSLGGRRSESQIRDMDWTGAVDTVLPVVSSYSVPQRPIIEP